MGKNNILESWISGALLDKVVGSVLRTTFNTAVPFKHILLEGFLKEKEAMAVAAALKKESFEEKDSDLFQLRQTADFESVKNKKLQDFYRLFQSKEFASFIESITGIKLRAGTIDMAGSLYIDTDYLLCHDDELQGRKIAYVYYLCEDFLEVEGGGLALLDDDKGKPGKTVVRYPPQWNSLMLFEVSKKSWHEVEEVISDKKRYAIGGWLH